MASAPAIHLTHSDASNRHSENLNGRGWGLGLAQTGNIQGQETISLLWWQCQSAFGHQPLTLCRETCPKLFPYLG